MHLQGEVKKVGKNDLHFKFYEKVPDVKTLHVPGLLYYKDIELTLHNVTL